MAEKSFEVSNNLCQIKAYTEEDQLKLFIDIDLHSRSSPLTPKIIIDLLSPHIPASVIDVNVLTDVCNSLANLTKIQRRRIARGYPSKPGIDGRLVFLKRKLSRGPRELDPDDDKPVSVNDLALFENIATGEAVARIYPPQVGTSGRNALGEEIPAGTGQPVNVQHDPQSLERKPAESSDVSYEVLVAKVDGYLEQQGNKLVLKEVFIVPGNLDTKVGSLNFIGTVQVNGDVLAGFKIEAKKGIDIRGSVNRTELICLNGGIKIKGRFFGEGKGRLIAAESLEVKSMQDGFIDCFGDIVILEEARNSVLRSKSSIQGVRAQIIGGKVYSARGVQIAYLGSEGGVQTEVYLGSEVETSAEYCRLLIQLSEHEKALSLLEAHLGPYAKNPDRIQLLNQDLRKKLEALLSKRQQVSQSFEALKEKQRLMLQTAVVREEILVSVEKEFYAGSTIYAGQAIYQIKESKKGPFTISYSSSKGEFLEKDYIVVEANKNEEVKK